MAKPDPPRIAVLGAGPIGLEAALSARSLNLPVTVYERGRPGDLSWYYVRAIQEDGELAWASPIWVHTQGEGN